VTLQPSSRLYLRPGTYHFRSLLLKSGARLYVKGAAKTDIRVLKGMSADNDAVIGPDPAGALTPSDIIFYVATTDAQSAFSKAVTMSPKCVTSANIYAPNGTILLNQFTTSNGAFFAKDVTVGHDAVVGLGSAFNATSRTATAGADDDAAPAAEVPSEYAVSQNYPNPFNPTTRVSFSTEHDARIRVAVYDVLGREVSVLADGDYSPGMYSVVWDGRAATGSPVPSGAYYVRMVASPFDGSDALQGGFSEMRKMLLLK
jgi:hypothetical protein